MVVTRYKEGLRHSQSRKSVVISRTSLYRGSSHGSLRSADALGEKRRPEMRLRISHMEVQLYVHGKSA